MYYDFFGFREAPFSIAPDPRYLYLSERHKEALAHLMYGVGGQGGFIVVTGEVGTGKTTVCRCFLEQAPESADIALILNPRLSARELLSAICDELGIRVPVGASIKRMIDQLNGHLLEAHAQGRHTVVIIDEAQNLSRDALEQLRLLTNLETAEKKLLQIVLLGQPELQEVLAHQAMRQLSQRVTARYHLEPLGREDIGAYVRYRMSVAGQAGEIFTAPATRALYRLGQGIPRLINLIGDRALLGAYSRGEHQVTRAMVRAAAREVKGKPRPAAAREKTSLLRVRPGFLAGTAFLVAVAALLLTAYRLDVLPRVTMTETEGALSGPVIRAAQKETPDPPAAKKTSGSAVSHKRQAADGFSLATYAAPDNNKVSAFQSLFSRWGHRYQPQKEPLACDFALSVGLQCLHRQGNWHSLVRMDRPAILRLFNKRGDAFYATLLSVDHGKSRLALDGRTLEEPVERLQSHWLGEYWLLWQPPAFMNGGKGRVDQAAKKAWLAKQLAGLIQAEVPDRSRALALQGQPLKEQIRWFQRQNGLIADGIPGTVTLMQMNSELNHQSPRLLSGPQLRSAKVLSAESGG